MNTTVINCCGAEIHLSATALASDVIRVFARCGEHTDCFFWRRGEHINRAAFALAAQLLELVAWRRGIIHVSVQTLQRLHADVFNFLFDAELALSIEPAAALPSTA